MPTNTTRPRLAADRAEPGATDRPTGPDRLVEALLAVTALVRAGRYDADEREGVLLDATVGRVRCVLLEQEPALRVELSPRERQVALMVAHGRTNQAIATSLEISVWTVSTHLRRIFAKLAVSSRAVNRPGFRGGSVTWNRPRWGRVSQGSSGW